MSLGRLHLTDVVRILEALSQRKGKSESKCNPLCEHDANP